MQSVVFRAAEEAEKATTAVALVESLTPAAELLQLPFFNVFEAVSDGQSHAVRLILGRPHPAWHAYYIEQRLYRRDFRVRRATRSSIPFFGSEVLGEADASDEDRAFARLGAEHELHESYVMPHRTADSRLFAVVMIGPGTAIDPAHRVAALCFSSALLFAALRIEAANLEASSAGARPRLTSRQLECLEWSRHGKSSVDIGNILGLSPRTVDEHVAAACRLLGVRTRVQGVSVALTEGLLPYPASPGARGGARNP